jgi:hypothetical protein
MIVIISLAAALAVGMVTIVALVRAGIAREERRRSIADRPATWAETMTRRIVGWYGEPPRIRSQADRWAERGDAERPNRALTLVSGR